MINFEDTTHVTNLKPDGQDPLEEVNIQSFNFAFMAYDDDGREIDLTGYLSWKGSWVTRSVDLDTRSFKKVETEIAEHTCTDEELKRNFPDFPDV